MKVNEEGDVIGTDIIPAGLTAAEREAEREELGEGIDPMGIIAELRGNVSGEIAGTFKGLIPLDPRNPGHESAYFSKQAEGSVKRHMDRTLKMNAHWLVEKLMELAEGIWIEQEYTTKKGVVLRRVYKRAPDYFAIKELLDRGFGKAVAKTEKTERKEVTVKVVKLTEY